MRPVRFYTVAECFESPRHGLLSSAFCQLRSGIASSIHTIPTGLVVLVLTAAFDVARITGVAIRKSLMQIFNLLCRPGCRTQPVPCLCLEVEGSVDIAFSKLFVGMLDLPQTLKSGRSFITSVLDENVSASINRWLHVVPQA